MRTKLILALLLLAACGEMSEDEAPSMTAQALTNPPGPDDLVICDNFDLVEPCGKASRNAGEATTVHTNLIDFGSNDHGRSACAGSNMRGTVCEHRDFKGGCLTVDPGTCVNFPGWLAADPSSIKMDDAFNVPDCHRNTNPSIGFAKFYKNATWQWRCVFVNGTQQCRLESDDTCQALPFQHAYSGAEFAGLPNDEIAVAVPAIDQISSAGTTYRIYAVYRDANYGNLFYQGNQMRTDLLNARITSIRTF